MIDFEKLGAFYLGRRFDLETDKATEEPILYDARDLTTHAVCVGMTGSGKTGLGIVLVEEAALDGIPVIAIDPKGDLGNLMLTFPELRPADFRPWIDESEAARNGRTPEEHARWTADLWRNGLKKWGQDPSRISAFTNKVDRTIYTPGSRTGRRVTILRSLEAPAPSVVADEDALAERVQSAVSGLLALLGIDPDPLRSREHILLSTILQSAWREGRGLGLASLVREIQTPSIKRLGVFDLETFYPASERFQLVMTLNNLIASPGFSAWMEGEPLDIGRILYGEGGRPRLSIFSISHLSDSERMFFVTILLNEIVTWVRSQPGSRSLRALLYMDEIFGFFPPTANPPSKRPMLTLLKQARAHGLGVVLATQNPVDLDYKGLANTGTWLLGRLQTERDKARVIDGLEGASGASGAAFDRDRMERTLSGLGSRVFVMNNVHEDEPVVMQTRWALSYLSGPLTREQIRKLNVDATPRREEPAQTPPPQTRPGPSTKTIDETAGSRPMVPPEIRERFIAPAPGGFAEEPVHYRPALLGVATLHYVNARAKVDEWRRATLLAPLNESSLASPWNEAHVVSGGTPSVSADPHEDATFAMLPTTATTPKRYTQWAKMLKTHLYRTERLKLQRCRKPVLISRLDESEDEFRARLHNTGREKRDLAIEKLRHRYAPKLLRLEERIQRAQERVEREQDQLKQSKAHTAISVGATVLGALFGRKMKSVGTVGRASTALRTASRTAKQKGDVTRALSRLEDYQQQLVDMESEFKEKIDALEDDVWMDDVVVEEITIAPRKTDLGIDDVMLVWTPQHWESDPMTSPRG